MMESQGFWPKISYDMLQASVLLLRRHSAFQLSAGFHFRELFLGMLIALLMVALLYYRFRSVALRHLTRHNQGIAMEVTLSCPWLH